ncbi:MAG: hypothetical protein H6622_14345 [Halobacteriovoraceae bacterium]|nr:hypothetical protein [Halobacteriovoraceae bacterium]
MGKLELNPDKIPEEERNILTQIGEQIEYALEVEDQVQRDKLLLESINQLLTYFNHEIELVKFEAMSICGVAYFHMKDYVNASKVYNDLAIQTQDSVDWFNLSISQTLLGEIDKGEESFKNCIKAIKLVGATTRFNRASALYYYGCSLFDVHQYEKSTDILLRLFPIYESLQITDTTFLYIRGIPSFSESLERLVKSAKMAGNYEHVKKVLLGIKDNFDEEGQSILEKEFSS